jgi:hypothetical protein
LEGDFGLFGPFDFLLFGPVGLFGPFDFLLFGVGFFGLFGALLFFCFLDVGGGVFIIATGLMVSFFGAGGNVTGVGVGAVTGGVIGGGFGGTTG